MKKLLLLAIVVLGISAVSFGQVASTATIGTNSASATIIAPILLTSDGVLSFGTVGAQEAASIVVLNFDGTRDESSTAALYAGGAPSSNATFHVAGTPLAAFTITKPDENTTLSGPGGAQMTITNWDSNVALINALPEGGSMDFKFKCTLNVGPSVTQTPGIYNGTYRVTVAYN